MSIPAAPAGKALGRHAEPRVEFERAAAMTKNAAEREAKDGKATVDSPVPVTFVSVDGTETSVAAGQSEFTLTRRLDRTQHRLAAGRAPVPWVRARPRPEARAG
jgi:hypothetical protein